MSRDFTNIAGDNLIGAFAPVTAAPLTFACWFKSDTTAANDVLMGVGVNGTQLNSWHIETNLAAGNIGAVYRDGATAANAGTTATFTTGSWFHAAAVFTSATARAAYLNAAKVATATGNITPSGMNETRISGNGAGTNNYDGKIAHVAIWNVALADADITLLAAGANPRAIQAANLVAYWALTSSGLTDTQAGLVLTATGTTVDGADNPTVDPPPSASGAGALISGSLLKSKFGGALVQ